MQCEVGIQYIHLFSADLHSYKVAEDNAECAEVLVEEEEVDPPLIGAALIVSQAHTPPPQLAAKL